MQIILNEKQQQGLLLSVRRYKPENDKAKQFRNTPIVKIAQKSAATQLLERKQMIKDQISAFELIQEKQLLALEKRKDELIKNIEEFCKDNEGLFKNLKGVSTDINKILSGDTEYVLNYMDYDKVGNIFLNLKESVAIDSIDELTKFYKSDDKDKTFEEYLTKNGQTEILDKLNSFKDEKGNFCIDKIDNDDKQALCELLEHLDRMYKMLFNTQNKIISFKEEYDKKICQFSNALERLDERLNSNNDAIQSIKKTNKKVQQIKTLA